MRIRTFVSTIFLFSLPTSASDNPSPTRLPKIVVRGSALSAPNPLDSADTTRITAKDLEQEQSVTIVDALRRVPGVYVMQNGGIGQEARVSLRGAGGDNTTVLVNGMPINDSGSYDNTFNLSRWMADDISEIQVIRGPMSSLYGPGGMGGVILIETKKGQGPHKTFAKAEAGSFNTFSQNVGIQGQRDLIDYHVNASRIQSAGARTIPSRYQSKVLEKADTPLHQENLSARLGAGSEKANISLLSRYLTRRLGYFQMPTDPYPWRQNYSESFNRLQGHFESASGRWHHDIGLGYYQNDILFTRTLDSKRSRSGSQAQVDWRQSFDITNILQLQVATDFAQEKLYWYKLPVLFNKNFHVSHGGIGGSLSYRVFENLMITGSTRVDKYQGISSTPTYRLGGQYTFEKVIMKGGIGTAFKAPTLQQKFDKDTIYTGNPDLKPEKSLGWDWGIERPFFQNFLTLGVTLFQNRIRDMIVATPGGTTNINLNKARTQGMEGTFRIQPTSAWTLEFAHTYTQTWDEKTGLGLIGNPLNKTTICLSGQITPEWQISGNVLYISPRDTYDAVTWNRVQIPSYTIVGAETSYQLNDQWQVYGRGENLLNRYYENPRSFQQPSLGVYVGLRAQC